MTNAKRAKQTDLFKSMQLLRLQNDMKLVNEKLEKNRSTPVRFILMIIFSSALLILLTMREKTISPSIYLRPKMLFKAR